MRFVEVDGSFGEGGGQILRTAVTFSLITGRPVRVSRIRAGRDVPGLRRQHVSSLEILGAVFESELGGGTEGSSVVTFAPGPPKASSLALDMRTAASITLVLQAVVPAVALTGSSLDLELVGGTDVPWSPTFDYFTEVVRAAYASAGISFSAKAGRRGYYPKGGGRTKASVEPCRNLRTLHLTVPPTLKSVNVTSRCAGLPTHVAERQLSSAAACLKTRGLIVEAAEAEGGPADSPGSSILVSSAGETHFIGSDELGSRGRPAEEVGRAAAERFMQYAEARACVDDNLADMLVPLLAFAPGQSAVRVSRVSRHLESGFYIAKLFSDVEFELQAEEGTTVVLVKPK